LVTPEQTPLRVRVWRGERARVSRPRGIRCRARRRVVGRRGRRCLGRVRRGGRRGRRIAGGTRLGARLGYSSDRNHVKCQHRKDDDCDPSPDPHPGQCPRYRQHRREPRV